MTTSPLHHIVRVRSNDDLQYVNPSLMDEIMINANQLENSAQSTAAVLWDNQLSFSVDPILWRFQEPSSLRNKDGNEKRNFARLGEAYAKGTELKLLSGPILATSPSDDDWRTLARNIITYQQTRLLSEPTQLDLLSVTQRRELRPVRIVAPALIAYSHEEDRINRLLIEESASTSGDLVAAQVMVPLDRLISESETRLLLESIPVVGVSAYLVWIPFLTEERLIDDQYAFTSLHHLIAELSSHGISVGHQYANYSVAALHDSGLDAAIHHLGWTDNAEPIQGRPFVMRSCQTYVPGLRRSLRYPDALKIGRSLEQIEYEDRYCECRFCMGAFDEGQHPLDLLIDSQQIVLKNGRKRETPTGRAVGSNTWHFLLSRRLEIQAFSSRPAIDVIQSDIERASTLSGVRNASRLVRLASELASA